MKPEKPIVDRVLEPDEPSVLDLLDHVLNKGVMASGDVTLGVAGVDLIYVRLSALLCSADRVLPRKSIERARRRRTRVGDGGAGSARQRAKKRSSR